MNLVPVSLKTAKLFVAEYHRHSNPPLGHKFSIGLEEYRCLIGVGIVGRPVNRVLDDGYTSEVLRLCVVGGKNSCSMLYSACRRASLAMGYTKVVTYIRSDESGSSLKASGWYPVALVKGREWSTYSRPRKEAEYEIIDRVRWEAR